MPVKWVCAVCKKEALYRTSGKCYCGDHWNYGKPKIVVDSHEICGSMLVGGIRYEHSGT